MAENLKSNLTRRKTHRIIRFFTFQFFDIICADIIELKDKFVTTQNDGLQCS